MSLFSSNESSDPQPHHAPDLERSFLRRGVKNMAAQRAQCAHCRRSPLAGERMRVFAAAEGEDRALCDVCVGELPAGALGEPIHVHRVGAGERRLNVVRAA